MNQSSKDAKRRRERNLDLVRRMRRGDDLMLSKTEDTFFPERPTIKKDRDALAKLYPFLTPSSPPPRKV